MKPFDLEEYLANPSKKLITRDGRKARIICTDKKDITFTGYHIVVLITTEQNDEICGFFTKDGEYTKGSSDINDLFFAPDKKEGWINIYRDYDLDRISSNIIFSNEKSAKEEEKYNENYITTIKIEWEE